jgi:hypothetical protein
LASSGGFDQRLAYRRGFPHYYVYVNDIKARQRRRKSGPAERVSHRRAESIIDLKQSLPDLKLG